MKKRLLCCLLATALLLGGCAGQGQSPEDGRLNVVCSLFPYYDFVRAIGGEHVEATLLIRKKDVKEVTDKLTALTDAKAEWLELEELHYPWPETE